MMSHDLAKALLKNENLPIALYVNGHTYASKSDTMSHGECAAGVLDHHSGEHLVIGNFNSRASDSKCISKTVLGVIPEEWDHDFYATDPEDSTCGRCSMRLVDEENTDDVEKVKASIPSDKVE